MTRVRVFDAEFLDDFFNYFICGGWGGVSQVIVGHPFDTVKTRIQTSHKYKGSLDCFFKTVHLEGFRALYKGMLTPLLLVTPINAMNFLLYDIYLRSSGPGEQLHAHHTYLEHYAAGAFAGIFTSFMIIPSERIKCLLQVQTDNTPKLYNGMVDCVKKLYKQGGIRSLYIGTYITILREVPANGMYFYTYELVKDYLSETVGEHLDSPISPSTTTAVIAGGTAGISTWLIAMPQDTLKSRLQVAPPCRYPNGARDVFSEIIRNEGVGALYRGLVPQLLRAVPANAACFMVFELCNRTKFGSYFR